MQCIVLEELPINVMLLRGINGEQVPQVQLDVSPVSHGEEEEIMLGKASVFFCFEDLESRPVPSFSFCRFC